MDTARQAVPIFDCSWKIRMLVITSPSTGLNKVMGEVVSGELLSRQGVR